jgi:hypothetical protein
MLIMAGLRGIGVVGLVFGLAFALLIGLRSKVILPQMITVRRPTCSDLTPFDQGPNRSAMGMESGRVGAA